MTQGGVKWKLRQILFWAGSQSQIIYQLWLHLFSTFPLALLEKKTVYFLLNVQLRRVIFLKSAVARDTDFETLTSAANQRSIVHFSKSLIHLSSFHSPSKLCATAEHWLMCQISQNGDWIPDCIFSLFQSWVVFDFRDAENFHKIKKSSRFPKLSSSCCFSSSLYIDWKGATLASLHGTAAA